MPRFLRSIWQVQFARTAHHPIFFFSRRALGKSSYHPASWHLEERQWSWDPLAHLEPLLRSELSYLVQLLPGWYSSGTIWWATISLRFRRPQILVPDHWPIIPAKPSASNFDLNEPLAHLSKDSPFAFDGEERWGIKNIPGNRFWLSSRKRELPFFSPPRALLPTIFQGQHHTSPTCSLLYVTIMLFSYFNPAKNAVIWALVSIDWQTVRFYPFQNHQTRDPINIPDFQIHIGISVN